MRIREIELDNFKSFGKLTTVPLLDGFTTISGPNGSGKSNIIDSLLFALGLSTTRTMRAERLPDLLNNLSGRNDARVTVRFCNDAGAEIEVTRRLKVKESGWTSTYLLNGKVSTLTDVHEELSKYNVSPTGYNVIMQGDVTNIVTMSATERRKIIDELAGVADFDRRIDQADKELFAVAEKIDHQAIVLIEIASRIETLQADRDQALKYLDLKGQKEKVERELIYVRVKDLESKTEAENKELEKLKEREDKLIELREEAELDLLTYRAELGRLEEEIKEKGGNEQILLRQELENRRGDLFREEGKLSNLTGGLAEKTKHHKNLLAQVKVINKHLNELAADRKQYEADQKATDLALVEKQGSLSAVLAEIEVMRTERDKSSTKSLSLHEELQALRDQRHKLDLRQTELKSKRDGLNRDLEAARDSATAAVGKSSALKGMLQSMDRKSTDDEALVLGMQRNIRQMESEAESTEEELEQKRKELEQINRRVIELETRREVSGESGYGRAVEAVLGANIKGVHGTIGQLGKVDQRYELALEMAIGSRLQHVVVDDDGVAETCIRMLRETKGGRATFVPLNKISVQPPGLLPNRPGVIDFAYNLVDFSSTYTKAFQYACGQTVVVDALETARKLIGQARMVSLEGDVLEKYGTITGGAVDTRNRLRFKQTEGNDLGVLKQKATQLTQDIKWLSDNQKELKTTLNEDRTKLTEAMSGRNQRKSDLENKQNELKQLEKLVEEVKPRLRALGDEIEQIEVELNEIEKRAKELDGQISRLQEQLMDATSGGKSTQFDRLIGESEDLKSEVDMIKKDATDLQRQIDRILTEERVEQSNRTAIEQQIAEAQVELDEVNALIPQHQALIRELTATVNELQSRSQAISEELVNLHKQKDVINGNITKAEIAKTRHGENLLHLEEERQKRINILQELEIQLAAARAELEHMLSEQPDMKPPNATTVEQLKNQIEKLDRRMRALEPVNMKALEEYNQTRIRQEELTDYLETLKNESGEIKQRIAGYAELKKQTFMEAFTAININFQDIFAELSHGHGKLELENMEDPFAGGLVIRAQPRDKKMQRIEALSGGEKSLTALSFVFAFQRFAPAPFYAFDEVDMMLDGANAERLARMVKSQSEQAQFVVVSLRRPMIENADHAIGVSLRADGFSKVVGIAEIKLPEEPARSA